MVALQEALGSGDPQLLQVHQRAVSGGLLKAPDEIAEAHAHAPGSSFERKTSTKILVQPLLCAGDVVILVLGLKWNYGEPGLPCAGRLNEHCLGALHGNFVTAEFFD